MSKALDYVGMTFGRLLVIARAPSSPRGQSMFHCICECGKTKTAWSANLRNGKTQSCGCIRVAQLTERNRARETTHGKSKSVLYGIWSGMIDRCRNPNNKDFCRYGARGIKVSPEWMDFEKFEADMPPRPSRNHSVDRIDGAKGYEPGNCRWALPQQQSNNRRDNIFVERFGVTKTIAEWADALGIKRATLYWRYKKGLLGEQLFSLVKNHTVPKS